MSIVVHDTTPSDHDHGFRSYDQQQRRQDNQPTLGEHLDYYISPLSFYKLQHAYFCAELPKFQGLKTVLIYFLVV